MQHILPSSLYISQNWMKYLKWSVFQFIFYVILINLFKTTPKQFLIHLINRRFDKYCQGCEPVSRPSNAGLTYNRGVRAGRYSYGTVITYSCNSGYYKSTGSDQRTCQSTGLWNGSPAVCKRGVSANYLHVLF